MSCSQFKQQRLPAWQPLLSPGYVAMLMMIVAAIFLPIGIGIAKLNSDAFDLEVRYDDQSPCVKNPSLRGRREAPDGTLYDTGCVYSVSFVLEKPLKAPIFMYYGLTNFYQNHRRYSNSKSDAQLAGEPVPPGKVHALSPLAIPGDLHGQTATGIRVGGSSSLRYSDFVYAPAGLVPWSMFNDTFVLYRSTPQERPELVCDGGAFSRASNEPINADGVETPQRRGPDGRPRGCHKRGIAWDTDVSHKYMPLHFPREEVQTRHLIWSAKRSFYPGAPTLATNDTCFNEGWYANEAGHLIPVSTDEDLMVWARVASMPTFRKLYRVIDEDLRAGSYMMEIHDRFNVASFGGEKRFALSTLSWIGGKNKFLAYLYIGVGLVAGSAALVLAALYKSYGTRAEKSVAMLIAE